MTTENGKAHDWAVSLMIAAVLLAPFLTVRLPFRDSLVAQAVLMLGATVALLVLATARKGWRARMAPSRPLLLGVFLYAAAAMQGAVIALLRGNDLTLIAGQLLAMGLLPLAAVGAFGLSPPLGWRNFAVGVVGGVTVGTLIQLGVTGVPNLVNTAGPRMMLANALSVVGIAPMALLLALALLPSQGTLSKAVTWGATGIIVLLILGSRIRSQWLVIPLGLAVYFAVGFGRARVLSRRAVVAAAAMLLLVAGAAGTTVWWWNRPRPNLATGVLGSGPEAEGETAVVALPGTPAGAIRVRGTLTCIGTGFVWIRARGSGASPESGPGERLGLNVAGSAPARFLFVLGPRAAGTRLSLHLEDPQKLECRSTALAVEEIAPVAAATLVGRVDELLHRPPDPGAGSAPGVFAADASIAFRVREMSAVLGAIRAGSWPSWVFGHGLGATFALDTIGYDNRGHIVRFDRPNYIHNFYLFLPFKLGALGTLEVLAALALFVCAAVRGARAQPLGSPDRHFLAAAAAAWITYIAWSAAAPMILDFRLAPFWGIVVALAASALQPRKP